MEGKRKKTGFTQSLTDGHTLRAIARTSTVPMNVQMTATVTDYAGADPRMLTYNTDDLASGEVSAKLKKGGGWIDNHGVCFVQLEGDLTLPPLTLPPKVTSLCRPASCCSCRQLFCCCCAALSCGAPGCSGMSGCCCYHVTMLYLR